MDITKNLKTAISAITGQLSTLKEELTKTNRQIAVIGAQIEELRDMPVSLNDYGQYIKARIENAAEHHAGMLEWNMFRNSESMGCSPKNRERFGDLENVLGSDSTLFPSGFFGNLGDSISIHAACFFFGDQMYESFMKRAQAKFGKRWGNEDLPTVEERRKTIFSLEETLVTLHEKRSALETEIDEISTALRS